MEAGDWLVGHLSKELGSVAWLVPAVFPEFARIFHPVEGHGWAELAARGGLSVGPETQFADLAAAPGCRAHQTDREFVGTLPVLEARILARCLGGLTSTPNACWFGLGQEFGWNAPGAPAVRLLHAPHRSFRLYRGRVEDVTLVLDTYGWSQLPNLWWPEDRAWCVRTDIDLDSTYVGGPRGLLDALARESDLEGLAVAPTDRVFGP